MLAMCAPSVTLVHVKRIGMPIRKSVKKLVHEGILDNRRIMGGPLLGEKSDAGYTASGFTSDWKPFQGKRVRITIEKIEEVAKPEKVAPPEEDPITKTLPTGAGATDRSRVFFPV
jgi:hypothetical protein